MFAKALFCIGVSFLLLAMQARRSARAHPSPLRQLIAAQLMVMTFLSISVGLYILAVAAFYTQCDIAPFDVKQFAAPSSQPSDNDEGEFFAIQTLTSVGYGMMLRARVSSQFYALSSAAMLVGGVIWVAAASATVAIVALFWKRLTDHLGAFSVPATPQTEHQTFTVGDASHRMFVEYSGEHHGLQVKCSCGDCAFHSADMTLNLADIDRARQDHLKSA